MGMIRLGYKNIGVFDEHNSHLIWEVKGLIKFKGQAIIGHGSKISVGNNGVLIFGDNFEITAESTIIANKNVSFGNGCIVSWEVLIMDDDFHKVYDKEDVVINLSKPIQIKNNVWIGTRCTILKGTVIPNGCIVASSSIINKEFMEDNTLIAGNPAIVKKRGVKWTY